MKTEFEDIGVAPTFEDEKFEYDVKSTSNEQVVIDKESVRIHPEEFQFTWRSSIIGSLLGCLVGKSLYKHFALNKSFIFFS
jgi:hypothetical protein